MGMLHAQAAAEMQCSVWHAWQREGANPAAFVALLDRTTSKFPPPAALCLSVCVVFVAVRRVRLDRLPRRLVVVSSWPKKELMAPKRTVHRFSSDDQHGARRPESLLL
jgi:hypothetical protein